MRNANGDILKFIEIDRYAQKRAWVIIPTNGFVKRNSRAVMGKGLAKQVSMKFQKLPLQLGQRLSVHGNHVFKFQEYGIITFPVKTNWFENASLDLIETSLKELVLIIEANPEDNFYIPRVGCGNGKLNWNFVEPIVEQYLQKFDNVILVHYTGWEN